jgi:predicted Zn-dependent peptidase
MTAHGFEQARVEEARIEPGLPVYVAPRRSAVATVAFCVATGSRHEPAGRAGITHLLEHVLLRPSSSGRSFPRAVGALGGRANGETSREELLVFASVPLEQLDAALLLLGALLGEPTLPLAGLEVERQVVLTELQEAASNPVTAVAVDLCASVFDPDPLGSPPEGSAAGVRAIAPADLFEYRALRVNAHTAAIAVVGDTTDEHVLDVLRRTACTSLSADGWSRPCAEPPRPPLGERAHRRRVRSDFACVGLATRGFACTDPRAVVADVLATLLCRPTTSWLYEQLRERRGLSYSIGGDHLAFSDAGAFRVIVGTAAERVGDVAAAARELLEDRLERGWTASEVAVAKRQAWGDFVLATESGEELAIALLRRRFGGGAHEWSPRTHRRALDALSAADVNAVAAEWLDAGFALAVAGDLDEAQRPARRFLSLV